MVEPADRQGGALAAHHLWRDDAGAFLRAAGDVISPDLSTLVGASPEAVARDAARMRGERPFVFTNRKDGHGVAEVADLIADRGGLKLSAR